MNTKKKIAFATAAALAMFGVSTVAHATPLAVTVNSVANATTSAAPQLVSVPSNNVIDSDHSSVISVTVDTGTVVNLSASATVKLVPYLNAATAPVVVGNGVSSISSTSNGTALIVYAYTTSATLGYVTITNGSYSTIVYIKGVAGSVYNFGVSGPTSISANTLGSITFNTSDIFGNPVGGQSAWATIAGATFVDGSVVKLINTASSADVLATPTLVLGSITDKIIATSAGSVVVTVSGSVSPTPVVGFALPVRTAVTSLSVTDSNALISSLNAQIASLNKTVADNKAASDKALADAKTASDKALADAKTTSDKALADAKTASDKALADLTTMSNADYNKLVARYNSLASSYVAKAKKYKFSYNVSLATNK